MHHLLKRIGAIGLAMALLATGGVYAAAEPTRETESLPQAIEYTQSGNWIGKKTNIKAASAQTVKPLVEAVSLPSTYSAAEYVERIEDQNPHGLCWSFVQNTLAAANVKKDEGKSVNYSEIHMGYSLSSSYSNSLGFERSANSGGNNDMSVAYMARGSGLVAEADDPFISSFSYRSGSVTDGYFSTGYLEEAPMLNGCSITQIKELIYEYGAAGVSICYNDNYYNSSTNTYYCSVDADSSPYDDVEHNHAITVIGWDDTRQCFLAQNSWGSSWGNGGRFWLSYHDKQVCDYVFATDYNSGDLPYDGLRNYNNFGWDSYMESSVGQAVYYATAYDTGDAEVLEGIGTYTVAAETKLEIYVNPYNGDGKNASNFKLVHTETFEKPGYYHISFADPVYLYGSKFNVKIKVTSATGGVAYAPLEMNSTGYVSNCVFRAGRSYFGRSNDGLRLLEEIYDNTWLNQAGWVWSMQAFTKSDLALTAEVGVISLLSEDYNLTLPKTDSFTTLSVTRNGASLPIYSNSACTVAVSNNRVGSGNLYYLKLGNGTHIRRTVVVSQSSSEAIESLFYVNGERPDANNSFTFNLSSNTFAPTVDTFFNDNWALYALPGGVGRIGKSMTVSLYRTVIYLRVTENDGITVNEYPITVYGPQASAVGFKDWNKVSGWALASMAKSVQYGLIQGDANKNLNPKNSLSRAEAVSMLVRVAGIECNKVGNQYAACYADVELNAWYANAVSTASYIGMVNGHNNPGYLCFSPSGSVTREQFAVMAVGLLAYAEGVDSGTFINRHIASARTFAVNKGYADLLKVSNWAKDAVYVALYLGVFNGANVNGRLYIQPTNVIPREQAATMMNNTMELIF